MWDLLKFINSDDARMAITLNYGSRAMVLVTESVEEALIFMQ
jgi:hypothetical protein